MIMSFYARHGNHFWITRSPGQGAMSIILSGQLTGAVYLLVSGGLWWIHEGRFMYITIT